MFKAEKIDTKDLPTPEIRFRIWRLRRTEKRLNIRLRNKLKEYIKELERREENDNKHTQVT